MARVWFVRRRGGQLIAPGGKPAFEMPLAKILFPLDLGPHRRLADEVPMPAPELAAQSPEQLQRVIVELDPDDVSDRAFSGYRPGYYDSSLSPRAAAERLRVLAGG